MKTSALILAAALLAAAPFQDKRGPKNKEVQAKYKAFMEENGKEEKAIQKDIADKKGDAAIKARLATIRKNATAASKLDYYGGSEEDVQKFKSMFEIFLDIRMKAFEEATWDEENAEKLLDRLQTSCRTCHELFRD